MSAEFPRRHRTGERWAKGQAPPLGSAARMPRPRRRQDADTAWVDQAGWYADRHGTEGDDFHRELVQPSVLRQLAPRSGQRVLDVGCGIGLLGRFLAGNGISTTGVDASTSMLTVARRLAGPHEEYIQGDAHALGAVLAGRTFDHAALVLVLQDLDPISDVLEGVCAHLRPGGRLAVVLTHPCFRQPRRATWGWDEEKKVQYRRIDAYASPACVPILTHPGQPWSTASTSSFNRPLALYLNALGAAGLPVTGCEELCSHRRGSKGRKSRAEEVACREFPVFLVLTAQRPGA